MHTVYTFLYQDSREAQETVRKLLQTGYAEEQITTIGSTMSEPIENPTIETTDEREGSFADVDPNYHDVADEREGSFADVDPNYQDETQGPTYTYGTRTSEGVTPDTSEAPKGRFADANDQPRSERDLISMLQNAGLNAVDAEAAAGRIRQGATAVVVRGNGLDEASLNAVVGKQHEYAT
jgi:hypothetical protein